jgi:hypothetical protein
MITIERCAVKRLKTLLLVSIFIATCFLSHTVSAAQDIWEVATPSGFTGTINNVVSFDVYVYIGTTQGVYKSSNRGVDWAQINTGLTNLNVTAVAIAWVFDADSGTYVADGTTPVYVTTSGGVFKSTLGDATWTAINTGLTQTNLVDIAIDQYKAFAFPVFNGGVGDASSLYAVSSTTGSIYRSDDAGANWTLQNTGISGEQIIAIMTEPAFEFDSGTIFAITSSNKVYSSTMFSVDGLTDESWVEKYATSSALNDIASLNAAPGTEFLATDGGILRSDDAGGTWSPKNSNVVDLRVNAIASDFIETTILYAGGYDGVYKSITGDGATTWVKANLGIGSVNVKKVNTNPTTSTLVYAMTDSAIYRLDLSDSSIIPVATDVTAPSAIDNLSGNSISTSSVVLIWSAPGDDDAIGTATSYDLRYATTSITEGNWAQAAPITGEPAPQVAGTFQNMTITGLSPDTQYYFAMKTSDEVPNISPISFVLGVHTLALPDTTAPIITAFVIPSTSSSLTVPVTTFTATDNVSVTGYCIVDTNSSAGCAWSATATTSYTFASEGAKTLYAFARDAMGNVSTSLNDSVTITLPLDTTPPVRSSLAPSGTLARNTTATTLSVTTDENATCHYATVAGTAYGSSTVFSTTGSTVHTTPISGLTNGTSHTYYVRCADSLSNTNLDDATITFSVQASSVTSSSGGGGGGSSKDTDAPHATSIKINNGDANTTNPQVALTLTARDANKTILMQISEKSNFSGAVWTTFKPTLSWTFTEGNGVRTIYARFKDGKENVSTAVSDTITLTQVGAVPYVAPVVYTPTQTAASYTFTRNLGMGTEGADVVELQKRLRAEGFFTYPTNSGYYGAVTAEAVKLFQRKYGIEATGFVGPLTKQKLNAGGGALQKDDSGLTLEGLIKLFLALGIIPQEKAEVAYAALKKLK